MSQVEERANAVPAWLISVIVHVLLFVLAFPGGGQSAGTGTLLEVGIVEMTGKDLANLVQDQIAAAPEEAPPQAEPVEALEGEPLLPIPEGPSREETEAQAKTEAAASPPASQDNQSLGSGNGSGRGSGFGSGAGFVLSSPLYYPKNAQNEGIEGRVRLAVFLWPTGEVKAEITESSGDRRLDHYSLRAVTEAWRYQPTQEPLRIMVALTYGNGRIDVDFEGSMPWNEEGSRP